MVESAKNVRVFSVQYSVFSRGVLATTTRPERGHSCPQQRHTSQTASEQAGPPRWSRLAADRNVRAPFMLPIRAFFGLHWPLWAIALGLLLPSLANAHIGSPNVFFEGKAGAYAVRVAIRPPAVLP